jgi:hypothetical protein
VTDHAETDETPSEIYVMFKKNLRGKQFDDESIQTMAAIVDIYFAGLASVCPPEKYDKLRNDPDFMLGIRGVAIMLTAGRSEDQTLNQLVTECAGIMANGKQSGDEWNKVVDKANAAIASRLIPREDGVEDDSVLLPWEAQSPGPTFLEASINALRMFAGR